MNKKFFLFALLVCVAGSLFAQRGESDVKTVLFLIPFYSSQYDSQKVAEAKTSEDVELISSFQLMGFWAGAQVALDEYEAAGVPLKVVVRDVSNSETKLRAILDNKELMSSVDLIIGPFFSKQFAIAARYAREYNIPIVNPFTTRSDIIKNNEYVYKLSPEAEARPATIAFVAETYPKHQIILYADSVKDAKEYKTYSNYFRSKKIPFKYVPVAGNIVNEIQNDHKNIVVMFSKDPAKMLMVSRDLIFKTDLNNLMLIVPEEWMESKTYDIEYYSKLNLHYFSDYYVDNQSEKTQVFVHKYKEKFGVPPTLDYFSYQGYDITRFFVEYLRNDKDIDRVKVESIAYPLSFDKTEGNGYENINVQFLEVRDNEIIPVGL